jgi:nicotinamidase/pyrazinamidase
MKTIFFDVDDQLDFLYPAGSLYVPGAEEILPVLAKLTRCAKDSGIQILSTADAHSEDDAEFKAWPPHCVVGTVGQQKAMATLTVAQPAVLSSNPGATVDASAPQIIIEKQHTDCFSNPNLAGLLNALDADRYVVYGVVSEICVRFAALGLLKTGKRVEVVTDAIRHLNMDAYDAMIHEVKTHGGCLTDSSVVVGR